MPSSHSKKTHIGQRELQPETQMLNYGYDPALSEGAVKPPVFLTSTFIFNSAEEGAISLTMFPDAVNHLRERATGWFIRALIIPTAKSLRTDWPSMNAVKARRCSHPACLPSLLRY